MFRAQLEEPLAVKLACALTWISSIQRAHLLLCSYDVALESSKEWDCHNKKNQEHTPYSCWVL